MNKKQRIILLIAVLAAALAYCLFFFGQSASKGTAITNGALEVTIKDGGNGRFITAEDVAAAFHKNGLDYFGKKASDLPIAEMEKLLATNSFVKKADVYTGIDGVLYVDIEQRTPILRVYEQDDGSFYIDNEGFVFRTRDAHPCSVPIVSGNVPLPFSNDFTGSITDFLYAEQKPDSILRLLCGLGNYIASHPFWSAQIEQIYFDTPHSVELTPRIGAHIIKIGALDNYEYKLRKLMSFYRNALPAKGWNTYSTIDISFGNQVVGQKK
jgi:cell division protein FtsQ